MRQKCYTAGFLSYGLVFSFFLKLELALKTEKRDGEREVSAVSYLPRLSLYMTNKTGGFLLPCPDIRVILFSCMLSLLSHSAVTGREIFGSSVQEFRHCVHNSGKSRGTYIL